MLLPGRCQEETVVHVMPGPWWLFNNVFIGGWRKGVPGKNNSMRERKQGFPKERKEFHSDGRKWHEMYLERY